MFTNVFIKTRNLLNKLQVNFIFKKITLFIQLIKFIKKFIKFKFKFLICARNFIFLWITNLWEKIELLWKA